MDVVDIAVQPSIACYPMRNRLARRRKPIYRRAPQLLATTPRINLVRVVCRTPPGCTVIALWFCGMPVGLDDGR